MGSLITLLYWLPSISQIDCSSFFFSKFVRINRLVRVQKNRYILFISKILNSLLKFLSLSFHLNFQLEYFHSIRLCSLSLYLSLLHRNVWVRISILPILAISYHSSTLFRPIPHYPILQPQNSRSHFLHTSFGHVFYCAKLWQHRQYGNKLENNANSFSN